MPSGRQLHRASTRMLALAMVVVGVAMLVATLARGGGPFAVGVLLGVLFVAAGGARLYLLGRD
jgi:hypothetical protein